MIEPRFSVGLLFWGGKQVGKPSLLYSEQYGEGLTTLKDLEKTNNKGAVRVLLGIQIGSKGGKKRIDIF